MENCTNGPSNSKHCLLQLSTPTHIFNLVKHCPGYHPLLVLRGWRWLVPSLTVAMLSTQFNMRGLRGELNDFFSSTSIHGFPYISNTNSRSTRIIWTLIVLAGFGITSYFLYNSVSGFSTKLVSTTIETRSIQEFPFPAVTFYPGDHSLVDSFTKTFLSLHEVYACASLNLALYIYGYLIFTL